MTLTRAPESLNLLFRLAVVGLVAFLAASTSPESPALAAAAAAVGTLALLPAWLWCSGRVGGLPLLPILGLTYLPTYAIPLLDPTPEAARYPVETRLAAAGAVCLFLAVAAAVWYPQASRPAAPRRYYGFRGRSSSGIFVACVALGVAYLVVANAGWLPPDLPQGAYSVLRTVCVGLASLGVAVLSYRRGARQLGGETFLAFAALYLALLVALTCGLTIVGAASSIVTAAALFALGRGRVPFTALAAALACFAVLHAGKSPMRAKYWQGGDRGVAPADYPAFYAEWVAFGLDNLARGTSDGGKAAKVQSLAERSSLLQMLTLVIDKTGDDRPPLLGETYAVVPEMMVPRILLSEKVFSHEGTSILSVHFGRQTRKETLRTTIGFGHLAEAYANFRWPGVVGLGLVVGGLVGAVTRWSAAVPIDSFRGLTGLLVLGVMIQTEHTAGVTAGSVSQGVQLLVALAVLFMEPKTPGGES